MNALRIAIPFVLITATGCPNPADDAPKAKVGETKSAASKPAEAAKPAGATEKLAIDAAASSINFVGSKVTGKHDGGFKTFSGTITLDPANLTASSVSVEIDMSSTWADDEKLTGHLKSPDFFDAEKFPKATFALTKIEAAEGGMHTLSGTLDLHGTQKAISFPAKIAVEPTKVSATAEFSLDRKSFGIVYPGKPDDLIRDDVLVKLNLEAPRS